MDLEIEERHIRWGVILEIRNNLDDVLRDMRAAYVNISLKDRTNRLILAVDDILWMQVGGHKLPRM